MTSDYLVDRQRLKRRLAFWRTLAILAAFLAAAAAAGRLSGGFGGDFVARIDIEGIIVRDGERLAAVEALAEDDEVRAVVVHIDSPGGTVAGGESLHRALRSVSEKKPVVAVLDGLATSAAYMVAVAADRIYARESTLTGSIGVVFQTAEITRMLEMIGVRTRTFRSGDLKAVPDPLEPVSSQAAAAAQGLIDEIYAMFRDLVLERRGLASAEEFADGRVFTGRRAVEIGLVDEIGGQKAALAWLEGRIPEDLPVRRIKLRRDVDDLVGRIVGLARKTILSERLTLDGLISVWHPDLR